MPDHNVDSDALRQAAQALSTYISDVQGNIQRMQDAATDCSDNMGSDVYSQKAISKLEDCIKELKTTLTEAQELREKILTKIQQIEDSGSSF